MSLMPSYMFSNGEPQDMYVWDPRAFWFKCVGCDKVATEGHCASSKHQKNMWYTHNMRRSGAQVEPTSSPPASSTEPHAGPPQSQSLIPAPWSTHYDVSRQARYYHNHETSKSQWHSPLAEIQWRMDVEAWGISANAVVSKLGGGPDFAAMSLSKIMPASASAFSHPMAPPTYATTKGFWGPSIFDAMIAILQELVRQGGRLQDLHYFASVPEDSWQRIMVYSDASKPQTATPKSITDAGMWWPCIAVPVGGVLLSWCQDFALNKAMKVWETHLSRCHIYVRRGTPTRSNIPAHDHVNFSTVVIEEIDSGSEQ